LKQSQLILQRPKASDFRQLVLVLALLPLPSEDSLLTVAPVVLPSLVPHVERKGLLLLQLLLRRLLWLPHLQLAFWRPR
jgi:hypothetical protein